MQWSANAGNQVIAAVTFEPVHTVDYKFSYLYAVQVLRQKDRILHAFKEHPQ